MTKSRKNKIWIFLGLVFAGLYMTVAIGAIHEFSNDANERKDFEKASLAACFANPVVAEYLQQNGPGIIGVHYFGAEHHPINRFCSVKTGDGNTKWLDFIPSGGSE